MERTKRHKLARTSGEELRQYVANSHTMRDILDCMGMSYNNCNYKAIRSRIEQHGIDINHLQVNKGGKRRYIPKEEIFTNPRTVSLATVRRRFEDVCLPLCSECGQVPIWNGKPLRLHLDHINGNNLDCREENLRWLCPNCHTQTETYCRNKPYR